MQFEITEAILKAINSKLSEDGRGASASVCRKYGISPSAFSKILSGRGRAVQEGLWFRLCSAFPEIAPLAVRKKLISASNSVPLVFGDNATAALGSHAVAVSGMPLPSVPPPVDSSEIIDRYRLRVQGRLISLHRDPVALVDMITILEEEARGNA